MTMTLCIEKCWRCRGDGHFWRVPDGFNPFRAGGWATARASYRVECYTCRGTGVMPFTDGETLDPEKSNG